MKRGTAAARAREIIRAALARGGPVDSSPIRARCLRAGLSDSSIHAAARSMNVRIERRGARWIWSAPPSGLREVEAPGTTIRALNGGTATRKAPKKTHADVPIAAYVVLVDAQGAELARCAGIEGAHALGRVTPRAVAIVASDGRVLAGDDQGVARLAARRWVERARQDPRGVAASSADATGNGAGGTCGSARQGSSVAGSASPGEAA